MQFSPASGHFIPLRSIYSPKHPVLKHPQSMFLPLRERQVFTSIIEYSVLKKSAYQNATDCVEIKMEKTSSVILYVLRQILCPPPPLALPMFPSPLNVMLPKLGVTLRLLYVRSHHNALPFNKCRCQTAKRRDVAYPFRDLGLISVTPFSKSYQNQLTPKRSNYTMIKL
jgi:hypothetical protein